MTLEPVRGLRFIPASRRHLVVACARSHLLSDTDTQQWQRFSELYSSLLHFDFHRLQEAFKAAYAPLDPNADTRNLLPAGSTDESEAELHELLQRVLDKANYEALGQADLQRALQESSLFDLRLQVDFDDFDEVLLFCRGQSTRSETLLGWFGLRRREVTFTNYDRVVLYLKFRDDLVSENPLCRPGATLLKLFQDVPKADLEMLFPNTQVRMRLFDKLVLGVPAAIGGGIVVSTKLGGSLILLASLAGYWLGAHNRPVHLDKAALVALMAGFGALALHFWKQFNNFKNRKLRFVQSLTQNLYFKNLDNNAGVFYRLLDEAEEEEGKEALLAYFFLWQAASPMTREELDETIESWLSKQLGGPVDFEIDDALQKLRRFQLVRQNQDARLEATPIEKSLQLLDQHWDQLFPYAANPSYN